MFYTQLTKNEQGPGSGPELMADRVRGKDRGEGTLTPITMVTRLTVITTARPAKQLLRNNAKSITVFFGVCEQ